MTTRNPTTRMWAEACRLIEQADRLHRQFFQIGRSAWEPPADVYEDERELAVVVALPGVQADRVEVSLEHDGLLIRAERPLPFEGRGCAIRRLEIPHGRFERRIPLPPVRLQPALPRWVDGCLVVILRKQ